MIEEERKKKAEIMVDNTLVFFCVKMAFCQSTYRVVSQLCRLDG